MAKKSSRTKSVEAGIGLVLGNFDLLFEIFLRIPAKSLIRFKLVCKSWLSLISDTEFGITHSRRNTNIDPIVLYYQVHDVEEVFISLHGRSSFPSMACLEPFRQNSEPNFSIAHSCNGLILFKQSNSSDHIVLNPTTQKYRIIKASDSLCKRLHSYAPLEFFLVFEPLKSQHYKAVIVSKIFRNPFRVHIFSSQSGTWKDFAITTTPGKCCTRKIYWNGSIHWLNENNFYMQFDVDAEKLIETPLPPKPRILGDEKIRYFGESNGRLFLIQCHRDGALGFRILEMDMKTHSWSINQQINLRPLALQFPEIYLGRKCRMFYDLLYVKSGDDMKSFSLVLAIPDKVVSYEVKKGKSHPSAKVVCELPSITCYMYHIESGSSVQPLMECLAPV